MWSVNKHNVSEILSSILHATAYKKFVKLFFWLLICTRDYLRKTFSQFSKFHISAMARKFDRGFRLQEILWDYHLLNISFQEEMSRFLNADIRDITKGFTGDTLCYILMCLFFRVRNNSFLLKFSLLPAILSFSSNNSKGNHSIFKHTFLKMKKQKPITNIIMTDFCITITN